MIKLEGIEKVYRTEQVETLALSNINFAVDEGEFISVMGPSGSGKSTLLNVIGLLDEPSAGEIVLNGQAINSYADRYLARIRNEEVGFIFQSFHLIADLNVVDNVEIPLLYRRVVGQGAAADGAEGAGSGGAEFAGEALPVATVGRAAAARGRGRAIVAHPHILLADEPTGNLDSQMGDEIMGIMHQLNEEGTTIVMVTHDQRLADRTGRTVRLFDGRQVQ